MSSVEWRLFSRMTRMSVMRDSKQKWKRTGRTNLPKIQPKMNRCLALPCLGIQRKTKTRSTEQLLPPVETSTTSNSLKTPKKFTATMSGVAKSFEPLFKRAARVYQGMLSSELNKMGEFIMMVETPLFLSDSCRSSKLLSVGSSDRDDREHFIYFACKNDNLWLIRLNFPHFSLETNTSCFPTLSIQR